MTLKELILQNELKEGKLYKSIDTTYMYSKETVKDILECFNLFSASKIAVQKALHKQKLSIGAEVDLTVAEAMGKQEVFKALIDSSALEQTYPALYEIAVLDYLNICRAIELHLVTHNLEGKIKRNEKKNRTQNSDEENS